jgi:hypothetical protein
MDATKASSLLFSLLSDQQQQLFLSVHACSVACIEYASETKGPTIKEMRKVASGLRWNYK